jgi:hypothetical protein
MTTSSQASDYEYAERVTAQLADPSEGITGPALVMLQTEHLGYIPLTVEQAAELGHRVGGP